MYIEGKVCWLNNLDAAVEQHIKRVHLAIRMTPFEISTNKNKPIPNLIPIYEIRHKNNFLDLQVGD